MDRVIGMKSLILISLAFLNYRYDVLSHSNASAALLNTLLWLLAAAVVVIVVMIVVMIESTGMFLG